MLAKGIVKFELCVFNCFGNTVYFVLAVMDVYFWVSNRDYIDFSVGKFLLEYRPLFEAHTDFHLVSKHVLLLTGQFFLFVLDHSLEIDIYFNALQLVISLTLTLQLTNLLHFESSRVSVYFDLIDFVSRSHFSGLKIASLGSN